MTKTRWLLALALVAALASFYAFDLGQHFSVTYFKSQEAVIQDYYQANPVGALSRAAQRLPGPGSCPERKSAGALMARARASDVG